MYIATPIKWQVQHHSTDRIVLKLTEVFAGRQRQFSVVMIRGLRPVIITDTTHSLLSKMIKNHCKWKSEVYMNLLINMFRKFINGFWNIYCVLVHDNGKYPQCISHWVWHWLIATFDKKKTVQLNHLMRTQTHASTHVRVCLSNTYTNYNKQSYVYKQYNTQMLL